MTWKKVVNSDPGDADHFGGNDTDKISDLFSGVDIDTVDVNSDWKFRSSRLQISNPANTFKYIITSGAITTADKILNLPVITGTDTIATLGLAQTFSQSNIFSAAQRVDSYIDLKAIAEPGSPALGFIRLFIDTVDGKTKIKRSNGDVVIVE